jgi:hypothetical protein
VAAGAAAAMTGTAGALSVGRASAGACTSTHSWEAAMSLPVSHWFSAAAFAAESPTSALGIELSTAAASGCPFVKALSVPASISVRPALATVGSV